MLRWLLRLVGKVIAQPIRWRLAAFEAATQQPQQVQETLLRTILARQTDTGFGRDHGFGQIRTVADYRRQVAIAPYERLEPYIARVRQGDLRALLADPQVLLFALTSGTTAARKYIPITPQYLADYRRGWNLWGLRAMRDHRPIILRPMLQLVGDPEEFRTEAGIPCGSLSGLTAQVQKHIIRWLYAVPACTGRIKDAVARTYVALRFSVPRAISMILAANPSSLLTLARALDTHKEPLLRDLRDGTLDAQLDLPASIRTELTRKLRKHPALVCQLESAISASGALLPSAVWPNDKVLIGTWTGGSVGPYLRQLPKYYGQTWVRDLGLLASEGRMTLPFDDNTPAGVLDVTTHYFEFIPEGEIDSPQPTVLGAHEVEAGRSYFIVPTTAAGLYRYQISDLVRVTGFFNRTPLIEFLGKGNRFASLTGEKLSEHQVTQAQEVTVRQTGLVIGAYSVAPCWDDERPYYGLFVEANDVLATGSAERFLTAFEAQLCALNTEYESKRQSGRLGPVRLLVVPTGFWAQWDRARQEKAGGPPEQYKHPCLIGDLAFRAQAPVQREQAAPAA
jgi:hypothetical protein